MAVEWIKHNLFRGCLLVLAALLVALSVFYPKMESERLDPAGGEDCDILLQEGVELTVPLAAEKDIVEVMIKLKTVKEAKGLDLVLTLSKDGAAVAEKSLSLAKARPRATMKWPMEKTVPAGQYTLTMAVKGEGNVTIYGTENPGADPAPQVWVTQQWEEHAVTPWYAAVIVALVALIPAGKPKKNKA